jgi:hypothetical protein
VIDRTVAVSLSCSQRLLERLSGHHTGCCNAIGNLDPLLRRWLDLCIPRQRADALTDAQLVPKTLIAAGQPTDGCAQQKRFGLLRVDEFECV